MTDSWLLKQLLYGELCEGKRSVGGQKKRYKDCIKAFLQDLNITVSNWEQLATNRTAWHSKIFPGVRAAEKRCTAGAQQKRVACKARAAATSTTAPAHVCPMCGRAFRARISLSSHLWTHSHRPSTWPGVMVIVVPDGRTTTTAGNAIVLHGIAERDLGTYICYRASFNMWTHVIQSLTFNNTCRCVVAISSPDWVIKVGLCFRLNCKSCKFKQGIHIRAKVLNSSLWPFEHSWHFYLS